MNNKFLGFKIEKSDNYNSLNVRNNFKLPYINSFNLPSPLEAGKFGGGLAYDVVTERPYYSDGLNWYPVGTGSSGNVSSYSLIKGSTQIVQPYVETTLTNWEHPAPFFHTISGWNTTTGIYTAPSNHYFTVACNIAWSGGFTNLGDRTLRIEAMKSGGSWEIIKETKTQADPDKAVETTQECSVNVSLYLGDKLRITVYQNSPMSIDITGNNRSTSVNGLKIS